MPYEEIYTHIINKAELSEKHKQELINKRGFSDSIIEKFQFRSAGPELASLEEPLRETFPEPDLVGAGVFIKEKDDPSKPARINPQLLTPNILIPYLDKENQTYHLRPHKLGFESVPIQLYQLRNLQDNPHEIILTEGEFKAVAGMAYEIPTLAVPGIQSYSETHFFELVKVLNEHKVKKVFILFDNEVKDDPSFPEKFKDNPSDRYDTPLYAYYMALKLEREGKETRIANLPDGWRENGKIDLDGALAQGKTAGEIKKILYDSKTRKEFLADLSSEARQVVLRKLAQKRHRSYITKEWGHYVAERKKGKHSVDEVISNFLINIIATHETGEGIMREVVFINEQNKHSTSFTLTADDMARNDNFSAFCLRMGDFIWRGNKEDLFTLWESEFLMMDEGRHIVEPDHIGWIEKESMWVFGNVALKHEGETVTEIRPDKSHIFWIEKRGIKPVPLAVTSGKNTIAEGIPYLNLNPFDEKELYEKLADTLGANQAKMALGWCIATLFLEEIFDKYSAFPFLFITGKRGSGKSTVAEWLMNLFGLENSGKMASETTPVAIQRFLSYYSSLPFFLDEYRNTEQIKYKTGLLRNAYNRQSAGKGTREGFGIREAKIRGTLLISGEETPEDNALLTRCIPIYVSEKMRVKNHFGWFQANRQRFSGLTFNVLKRKGELVKKFFEIFEESKAFFVEQGRDERLATNYACVTAGYSIAFQDEDTDFAKWIDAETRTVQADYNEEQPISVFFEHLLAMRTKGFLDDRYWEVDTTEGRIFLYFEGLYNEWSQEHRKVRGVIPFKKAAIRAYLKEEDGFEQIGYNKLIKGIQKTCVVFNAFKCCENIKNLVGFGQMAQEEKSRAGA